VKWISDLVPRTGHSFVRQDSIMSKRVVRLKRELRLKYDLYTFGQSHIRHARLLRLSTLAKAHNLDLLLDITVSYSF